MFASLDPKSLGVASALMLLAMAGVMVFVLLTRKTYAGFRHWTACNVLLAVAVLLLVLQRTVVSAWAGIVVGNYLVMLASALFYDGLALFHGRKLRWRVNGALHLFALLCAAGLLYFLYVEPNRNLRIACSGIFRIVVLCGILEIVLRERHSAVHKLLAAVAFGSMAFALLRIGYVLTAPPLSDMASQDALMRAAALVEPLVAFLSTFGMLLLTQSRLEEELKKAGMKAERASRIDSLTGLWNRYHFDGETRREIERARRYGHDCSLLLFDIDHFKHVNDTYGHLVGDEVLKQLATLAGESLRTSDLLCRWGGEEFIVLLPSPLDAALATAQKLRLRVAETKFTVVGRVTISIGVALLRPSDDLASWTLRADQALYRAKARGRNRVEHEAPGDTLSPLTLHWNQGFSSGDPVIDEQHKAIFEKSNLLLERCAAGDAAGARGMFAELLDDASRHFVYEEAILARLGYPDLEAHRREHQRLLDKGHAMLAGHPVQEASAFLGGLSGFIVRELALGHIAEEDLRYVELMHSQRAA